MYISHIVAPTGPSTSNLKSMIRMPRPAKGSLIPSRSHGQCRWHLELTDSEYTDDDGEETAEEWTE